MGVDHRAYYNENNKFAAAWLRELIKNGLIADGDVDDRSICDVRGQDIAGYTQCNFFAGVAGWSLALQLAGWPDDRPIWTGSCPCQDFSNAGLRKGFAGDRDLWPEMRRLIEECRPDVFVGEQVDDAPEWYDRTAADLEALDYACGACVVPACAVGAPHERSRLWFVADSGCERRARNVGTTIPRQHAFPRIKDGGGVANLDELPAICQPILCRAGDGIPNRVAFLHGLGNAIVPAVAAEFIQAFMETE